MDRGPATPMPPLHPPRRRPPPRRRSRSRDSAPPSRPSRSPRLATPSSAQHVWLTGPGYNAVPAGDTRSPPCGCASRHGPTYQPGPHATRDCPHRYISSYGSCPGFLMTGMRDPQQWSGDNLTRGAKDAWIKLKVAARQWPHYRWFLITRVKGQWVTKRIPSS